MYKLTDSQQDYLLNQPESGMGYQLVEIRSETSRQLKAVAYNADLVLEVDDPMHKALFETHFIRGVPLRWLAKGIREIAILTPEAYVSGAVQFKEARGAHESKPGPARNAPVGPTSAGEVFKRFTAYKNDRRLRPDGSYVPGTYATTEEDAAHVHTGKEAVERYALPDPTPAVNVFTIQPKTNTAIQRGIVEPAFGHKGGGVEVIFTSGTTAGTVSGPKQIPSG